MHGIGSHRNLPNPVIFRIVNKAKNKISHCGVLQFSALENSAYLPQWMMDNLLLKPGDAASFTLIENVAKLSYVKLKPISGKFFDNFDDPKAILENALRKFTVLTKGDTFLIKMGQKAYTFFVDQVAPETDYISYGCIVDSDLKVELDSPLKSSPNEAVEIYSGEEAVSKELEFLSQVRKNKKCFFKYRCRAGTKAKFELVSVVGDGDIYISKTILNPDNCQNDWENIDFEEKRKTIAVSSAEHDSKWLFVGVSSLSDFLKFELAVTAEQETSENCQKMSDKKNYEKTCDYCDRKIAKANLAMHAMRCRRVNWRCPECSSVMATSAKDTHTHCERCKAPLHSKNLQKHFALKHKAVQCACGQYYEPIGKIGHTKDCPLESLPCKHCNLKLSKEELADHELYCGGRSKQCELCGKRVATNSMTNHRAAEHGINPCSPRNEARPSSRSEDSPAAMDSNNDVEQMMIDKAISESLKESSEGLEEKARPSRGQKCPYCNQTVDGSEDIGLHMLRCYEND
ncbi:hypothetical protein MHBO_001519 [Bonamia ostreae]